MGGSSSSSAASAPVKQMEECFIAGSKKLGSTSGGAEKFIPATGSPMRVSDIHRLTSACFRIQVGSSVGSGCLVNLRLGRHDRLCGLLTNNHVLGSDHLGVGSRLSLEFEGVSADGFTLEVSIEDETMVFTDQLLDATFVAFAADEITEADDAGCTFLDTAATHPTIGDRVTVVQHPRGGEMSLAVGQVATIWGFDVTHTASTDYGSSGSMVVGDDFCVLAVHKARHPSQVANVAVTIGAVCAAVRRARDNGVGRLACVPVTAAERTELEQLGLQPLSRDGSRVFISPSSCFITALWFVRTPTFWYWTPTRPSDCNRDESLRECNWARISTADTMKVKGGYWDGQVPASRNVRLIRALAESGTQYLDAA